MKKIYIVMAVLATAALASCEQEKSFEEMNFGENDVVFSIQNGISTRSAEVAPSIRQGVIIPLESEDSEHSFFLEETVMNLDEFVPATKGTPAFTENVGTLYANNLSVYGDDGGFTTPKTFENENGGLLYKQSYNPNPWPDGSVGFYLNMPATPKKTNSFSITNRANGKITFTYTTPDTATDQEDLLFAYRSLTKDEHNAFLKTSPYGAPVLFNHALTAVKFRIGNETKDKVSITEVIFNELYDGGTCVIEPAVEDNYKNKKENDKLVYSSADAADWTTVTPTKSHNPISSGTIDGTVEYKATDKKFGDTWYSDSGSNTQNINDGDATHTFWLMPQTMSDAVTLTIKYKINNGAENTWTIAIGQYLKTKGGQAVVWKAGELRTYTIKVDDVNVKIEDEVSSTVKENIKITNTGNTDAFIRAAIVGQWLDGNGNPVFGFTDEVFNYYEVASWYQDQFVSTEPGTHGTFVGLAGYKGGNNPLNNWFYNSTDGFYYYTKVVKPGEATGQNGTNHDPLFTKYTVGTAPNVSIGGQVVYAVTFELEIATQAVTAIQLDGTPYVNWYDAWKNALGYDPR